MSPFCIPLVTLFLSLATSSSSSPSGGSLTAKGLKGRQVLYELLNASEELETKNKEQHPACKLLGGRGSVLFVPVTWETLTMSYE